MISQHPASEISNKRIALLGLTQAMGTALYVMLVAFILNILPFDKPDSLNPAVEIFVVLLLFIISASISSSLVFGYPAILALRQQFKEAVLLIAATVLWIVLFMSVTIAGWTVGVT